MSKFGWDLPPGVTQRMLDYYAGGYDEQPPEDDEERCPGCGLVECACYLDEYERDEPSAEERWAEALRKMHGTMDDLEDLVAQHRRDEP